MFSDLLEKANKRFSSANFQDQMHMIEELRRAGIQEKIFTGTAFAKELADLLNIPPHICVDYHRIAKLGDAGKIFYERLDGDLTVASVILITRRAKSIKKDTLSESLAIALKEYDALPTRRSTGTGKVIKCWKNTESFKINKEPKEASDDEEDIWNKIERFATEHVKDVNLSDVDKSFLISEFVLDIKAAVDDYRAKVRRRATTPATVKPSRRALVAAYAALNLQAPTDDSDIDLNVVKRQRNRIVKLTHPDRLGGSEATRQRYEEAIQARITIEEYAKNR